MEIKENIPLRLSDIERAKKDNILPLFVEENKEQIAVLFIDKVADSCGIHSKFPAFIMARLIDGEDIHQLKFIQHAEDIQIRALLGKTQEGIDTIGRLRVQAIKRSRKMFWLGILCGIMLACSILIPRLYFP